LHRTPTEENHLEQIDIMILGAGIAGLGAALRARELGREAVIFEARERVGGLLDNFTINGYRFDHAVHLSFATEPKVRAIFDATPFYTHPADAPCFETDRWLKHPVQNNLYPLAVQERVDLLKSFLARPESQAHDDYEAWLRHQYGDAIAERYPIRYTRKYWDTPAANLSTSWIGNRMRRAELDEIVFGMMTDQTPNTYYTKEMRYPKQGGYKAFIQSLIDAATIRTQMRVTRIDTVRKVVQFNDETEIGYQQLVSTLPLPLLATLASDVPHPVAQAAATLEASSIDLISVGFKRDIIKDLWFYIYDEDIHASRAYSPSVKSPDNVPPGCSSLQFEAYSRGRNSRWQAQDLIDNTRYALAKMGIAQEADMAFIDHRRLVWGNVIFDQGMEAQRGIVRDYLSACEVKSCGRFGEWDYFWSNQSFLSGYGWAG
jgi:protoporphyrinogen oxidase